MSQTKEQDKTPREQVSEVEIGNLHKKELRVTTGKMIQGLGKRMEPQMEKMQKTFNGELEDLKN